MRTVLRKVGNSRGVLIPAAFLAETGIQGEVEMRVERGRIVIASVKSPRARWFAHYEPEADVDVFAELPVDEGCAQWDW